MGLEGILRSQTLRATHYAYLNDTEEIRHFLKSKLPEIFEKVILSRGEVKEEARRLGNRIAESLLEKLLHCAGSSEPLAEPYKLSSGSSYRGAAR